MNRTGSDERRGRLDVICGCMFSGKTGLLIDRLSAAQSDGLRVTAFKHVLDARYHPDALATHDGRLFSAVSLAHTDELVTRSAAADVVGVDEVHFFGPPVLEVIRLMVAGGRRVWLAGIDFDAWGRPFPPMPELKEMAAEVHVRTAACGVCGAPARLSQRLAPVSEGDDMVGGPGSYSPRCRACFIPVAGQPPVY